MSRTTAALIAALLILAALARPYNCTTDTECEAEEAARCWIFCQR